MCKPLAPRHVHTQVRFLHCLVFPLNSFKPEVINPPFGTQGQVCGLIRGGAPVLIDGSCLRYLLQCGFPHWRHSVWCYYCLEGFFFLYHRDSSGNEGAMEEGYASLEGKTGKGKGRNLSIWCVSDWICLHHFLFSAVSICAPPSAPPPPAALSPLLPLCPLLPLITHIHTHHDPADLTSTLPKPVDTSSIPDFSWEPVSSNPM